METAAACTAACGTSSFRTIAAPRAGRTVARVIAIRAHLCAVDPDRERPRQFQSGLKADAWTLPDDPGLRTRELASWSLYDAHRHPRRLWCTRYRRGELTRHRCTHFRRVLPLAVFPHPRCSPCWITIRHKLMGCVHRAPCTLLSFSFRFPIPDHSLVFMQRGNAHSFSSANLFQDAFATSEPHQFFYSNFLDFPDQALFGFGHSFSRNPVSVIVCRFEPYRL